MDKKEYPFNLLECIFNEGIAIEIMQARPKEIIGVRDKLRNREGFIKNENDNVQWMIEK